jgi:hypothetical protein
MALPSKQLLALYWFQHTVINPLVFQPFFRVHEIILTICIAYHFYNFRTLYKHQWVSMTISARNEAFVYIRKQAIHEVIAITSELWTRETETLNSCTEV